MFLLLGLICSHNTYCYLDTGDMQYTDPSAETLTAMENRDSSLDRTELARGGKSSSSVDYIVTYLTTAILIALCQAADQIDQIPIEFLYDEKDAQLLVRRVRTNPPYR